MATVMEPPGRGPAGGAGVAAGAGAGALVGAGVGAGAGAGAAAGAHALVTRNTAVAIAIRSFPCFSIIVSSFLCSLFAT